MAEDRRKASTNARIELRTQQGDRTVLQRDERPKASGRADAAQERQIQQWVCKRGPGQPQLPFALWTKAIQMLDCREVRIEVAHPAVSAKMSHFPGCLAAQTTS